MAQDDRSFSAPKGTNDLLPPESWSWQWLQRTAMDSFALAGYAPVETPMFEHTEVFERGVGEATEVVGKQMYTFTDHGGRSLTLRPEGTAPVVRAVLEHWVARGALKGRSPAKLAYAGPMFRQERPQKGRHRQFFQVGIEAIGSDNPSVDAEVIEVGHRFIHDAGATTTLLLNTIGHPGPGCRGAFIDVLRAYLADHEDALAPVDRERMTSNPLRIFDSKEAGTASVMQNAPRISAHICAACKDHFEQVTTMLAGLGVDFELDDSLVRGLDYYTRTAFEFVSGDLGSQNAVGGGGRYDGLSEALGGPRLPAIGFALGIDRIALARDATDEHEPAPVAYVAYDEGASGSEALKLSTELRRAGISTELDHGGRSVKGQLKDAARTGARWVVTVGDPSLPEGVLAVKNGVTGERTTCRADELEGIMHG